VNWFILSLGAAGTQAAQFAVVKGPARDIPPVTMAPAAYVNAIRRVSAVLAVLLGRALFGEAELTPRLTAAVLAAAGAACLLLAH
jgi:uncharacterized membrane protein